MDRRAFIGGVVAAAALGPRAAYAQTPAKAHRVGLLMTTTPAAAAHIVVAFADGLRELGHVEARTSASSIAGQQATGSASPRWPPTWCGNTWTCSSPPPKRRRWRPSERPRRFRLSWSMPAIRWKQGSSPVWPDP